MDRSGDPQRDAREPAAGEINHSALRGSFMGASERVNDRIAQKMAPLARFERATRSLEGCCSVQLSYRGRIEA
jgi:hypothetical protein